jgi:hypothetical protein
MPVIVCIATTTEQIAETNGGTSQSRNAPSNRAVATADSFKEIGVKNLTTS